MGVKHWLPQTALEAWRHTCDLPTPQPPPGQRITLYMLPLDGDREIPRWPGYRKQWQEWIDQISIWCENNLRGPWHLYESCDGNRITLVTQCSEDHTLAHMVWR